MKRILLIGTGGTIASEVTDSGLMPELTTEQLLFPGQHFSWQESGLRPDEFVKVENREALFVEKKTEVYQ